MAANQEPPDGQGDGQADGTLGQRVGKLEAGQETLAGKLDHLIGLVSGKSGDSEPDTAQASEPGGSPGSVAEEIRAQLEERDRKAAARAKDNERDGTLAALQAKVAELTEQRPAPMPRRVENFMGWHA